MTPFWSELFLRKGWTLLWVIATSLWQGSTWAQSLEQLQYQSQELERAIAACGNDPECLTKAAQKAGKVMQGLQSSPEITRMADTPCLGFNQASYPSSKRGVECLPLNIRMFHKATLVTAGCTSEDERFTYAYVYEGLGQIIRDTNRKAFILNTLMPAPDGRWRLDLRHAEYFILKIADNCRPAGSVRFGPKDIDFGKTPSVALVYDHGYTNFGSETAFFSQLTGWVSPRAAEAHWGIGIPFQIGGGYTSPAQIIKAGLQFSESDVDTLFDGQTLTRTLRWHNNPLPQQKASHELEIEIRATQAKQPPCRIRVTAPQEGHKLVFSSAQPGQLSFDLYATATPAKYDRTIRWSLPKWDAATQAQVTPKNLRGTHLKVRLQGLPKNLSGLGDQVFTAKVDEKNCHTSTTRTVKLFFPREAKNNPNGKVPNWFYYWKQTPAARPKGQIVALDYGGSTTDLCGTPGVTGIYNPKFGYKVLLVCDLSKLKSPFELVFPLLDRYAAQKYAGMRTVHNIDTFAVAVLHEYQHFLADHNWYSKILPKNLAKLDKDRDGLPDHLEAGLNFNPALFQSYFANHPQLKKVGGDEEWLAYEIMRYHKPGSLDKHDWAYPGNQWTP